MTEGTDRVRAGEFEDDIDYSSGKQDQPAGWPKGGFATKEECCDACAAAEGCAAAVWGSPPGPAALCWYKTAEDVKHKSKPHAGKITIGCTLSAADGGPGGAGGFGGTLLLLLCGSLALYLGAGAALGWAQGRRPAAGLAQLHPHAHLWREWWGLIADGLSFSGGGSRGGKNRYAPVPAAEPPPPGGAREGRREPKKRRKEKGKRREKEKSGRTPAAAPDGEGSAAAPQRPPPPQKEEREWRPTPRAAHLAAGARETGVKVTL